MRQDDSFVLVLTNANTKPSNQNIYFTYHQKMCVNFVNLKVTQSNLN